MKNVHRILGIVMLIPILLWAITGAIFLTKPGYVSAYEQISPKLYPFDRAIQFGVPTNWSQIKAMKTVLGHHLLVLEGDSWKHLDPATLEVRQHPTSDEVRVLVTDAVGDLSDRYGSIINVEGATVFTDTDVVITLDWDTLSLQQSGPDTRLIDSLYRIHYLQWFSSPALNQLLGVLGLVFLVILTLLGISLIGTRNSKEYIE